MREGYFTIREALNNGLRIDDRIKRGSSYLLTAKNVRIATYDKTKKMSMMTYPNIAVDDANLVANNVTVSFPFPQIFKGRDETYLLSQTELFTLDVTNGTLNKIDSYDSDNPDTLLAPTSGGLWQFVDFGKTYMFLNGTSTMFRSGAETIFGLEAKTYVRNNLTINAGCSFRGRSIIGGFNVDDFYNSDWKLFWKYWQDKGVDSGISGDISLGSNFIMWSLIGGGDMLSLFYSSLIETGIIRNNQYETYSRDNPIFLDMLSRGDSGFMPMNWNGDVYNTKGLGNGVLVCGDEGIGYMPIASNTFGLVDVLPTGIMGRGAVGGNERELVFIDSVGYLWMIGVDIQPQKLGYREFFENMLGTDVTVTKSDTEDEYYIGNSVKQYILTRGGLTEAGKGMTTVVSMSGVDYAIFDSRDDEEMLIETDEFDLALRGIKLIERLSIGMDNSDSVYAKIYYRMTQDAVFSETDWKLVTSDGIAWFPIQGVSFKISIKSASYLSIDVDYISVFFKTPDKRYLRGAYVVETVR